MSRLERDIENAVAELGFELVTFERAGGTRRPLFRVRIDRPGAPPGRSSVTVDDCARVSRALGRHVQEGAEVPARSIVEVSSPGVERPLVRPSDYARCAGQRVLLQGFGELAAGRRRLEGLLLGLSEGDEEVELEVSGERLRVPVAAIAKANLVYDWKADFRG